MEDYIPASKNVVEGFEVAKLIRCPKFSCLAVYCYGRVKITITKIKGF